MKKWSTKKKIIVFTLLALLAVAAFIVIRFISEVTNPKLAFSQALSGIRP